VGVGLPTTSFGGLLDGRLLPFATWVQSGWRRRRRRRRRRSRRREVCPLRVLATLGIKKDVASPHLESMRL